MQKTISKNYSLTETCGFGISEKLIILMIIGRTARL